MSLSREQVLTAAVDILDDFGLADLTMRRLGDALGVKPGAFYWHFANKQSLLAGVADAICGEVDAPASGPWRIGVTRWAWALRATLLRHRDSADIVATCRAQGLMGVDVAAQVVPLLVQAGADVVTARSCVDALVRYVIGHTAEEQARAESVRLGVVDAGAPHGVDSESFGFGLRLLMDGIDAALA